MSEDEKRIFERFSARFPVKLKDTRDEYGSNVFLQDASAAGARLTTKEKFFINDYVTLDVKLPDGTDPLTLNGQVVWIKTIEPNQLWDIGLRFHRINLMKVQRLYKFVDKGSELVS